MQAAVHFTFQRHTKPSGSGRATAGPGYTYQGPAGNLDIQSNGWMYAWGGNATQFTSLAGISFPLAGSPLQPLSLYFDYQSANSKYGTGDPSYLLSNGAVHLAGSAASTNPTITSPTSRRPSRPTTVSRRTCIPSAARSNR